MEERGRSLNRHLLVGQAAIIQAELDGGENIRVRATIRGWQTGRYVLLDVPDLAMCPLLPDHTCVLRFVTNGVVCACGTIVVDRCTSSRFPFIRVRWPADIECVSIRRHERVELCVPCEMAFDGGQVWGGELFDLSVGGCRLRAPVVATVGERIRISCTLPDGGRLERVETIVRSASPSPPGAIVGCQFGDGQRLALSVVEFYVTMMVDSRRAGEDVPPRVIFVEQASEGVEPLQKRLHELGFETLAATSVVDALSFLRLGTTRVLAINYAHPELDGASICRCVRHTPRFGALPIFVYGGNGTAAAAVQEAGATAYFASLANVEEVAQKICQACPPQ